MRANIGSLYLDEGAPPLLHLWQDVLARYPSSRLPPWDTNTLHELRAIDVPFVRQNYLPEPVVPKILHEINEMYLRAQKDVPSRAEECRPRQKLHRWVRVHLTIQSRTQSAP